MYRNWSSLHGAAAPWALASFAAQHHGPLMLITRDSGSAMEWHKAIDFFSAAEVTADFPTTLQFPDWETLPYDAFSPHQDIISERLATLVELKQRQRGFLIVPVTTLLQRITPASFLAGAHFSLTEGQQFDRDAERLSLESAGYVATDTGHRARPVCSAWRRDGYLPHGQPGTYSRGSIRR